MISTLRGRITDRNIHLDKGTCEIVIDVAGVGYELTSTTATLDLLTQETEAFCYVYHHITEADQRLFGFATKEARQAFKGLLGAHGVGPSLALAVLATHTVSQLAAILDSEDVDALCETPGVGKKTAQRLLVELRSSLILPAIDGEPEVDLRDQADASSIVDVKEALAQLGYSPTEIRKALAPLTASKEGDSGDLLKQALQSLGGNNG